MDDIIQYFIINQAKFSCTISTVMTTGAASGAILTRSFAGAMKGAVFGAISAGAANIIGHGSNVFAKIARTGKTAKAILHGLSRMAISKFQNGTSKGGFLSGFAASLLGGTIAENFSNSHTVVKVTMAAIAGGTASTLGGGKFSNGAMSGAFIMLFNDLQARQEIMSKQLENSKLAYTKLYKSLVSRQEFFKNNPTYGSEGMKLYGALITLPLTVPAVLKLGLVAETAVISYPIETIGAIGFTEGAVMGGLSPTTPQELAGSIANSLGITPVIK